jgi:DNA-binding MurR/RpiR family transcriptional regulator
MNHTDGEAARVPQVRVAPVSLDQLSELLASVQNGESLFRLGNRTTDVLAGMLASPRHSAVYSITQLADEFGVHPSTLTRLAKSLGYRGFSDLQAVFRRHIAHASHFYSEQAGRLHHSAPAERESLQIAARVAQDETGNIAGMLNGLDPTTLESVVEMLIEAPRVRVLGGRQASAIASYLAYGLGMLRNDVSVLVSGVQGSAQALAQLQPDDLLVVCGCSPHTRHTVVCARVARECGVKVIALTDNHASPLAASAHRALFAPTAGTFFGNSMAAMLVLVEALGTLVAEHMGDAAVAALEYREAMIDQLQVEL